MLSGDVGGRGREEVVCSTVQPPRRGGTAARPADNGSDGAAHERPRESDTSVDRQKPAIPAKRGGQRHSAFDVRTRPKQSRITYKHTAYLVFLEGGAGVARRPATRATR